MKSGSPPSFTPVRSAAITQRNHFYRLFQRESSDLNRRLFVAAHNKYQIILERFKSLFTDGLRHVINLALVTTVGSVIL